MTVGEAVTLIAAIAAALVSIITAVASLRTGSKLDTVHSLVNGQSVRMEGMARDLGAATGIGASSPPEARAPPPA